MAASPGGFYTGPDLDDGDGTAQALAVASTARHGTAVVLFVAVFALYNANGREIATFDSQARKFLAREIAVHFTLVLDRVVAERPGLAERAAFGRDRQGHVRSTYPIAPGVVAGAVAFVLHRTGLVDMDAALAPNFVAKITASGLTAAAVALIFLALGRLVSYWPAIFASLALGVGTTYWTAASQTLWGHESVAFGTALALWAWLREPRSIHGAQLIAGGIGLALAAASRHQVIVLVLALLVWLGTRVGVRRALVPAVIVAAALGIVAGTNMVWFGTPLGGLAQIEALHPQVHALSGPVSTTPWVGGVGLLVSPNRGLFVFSPVLLIALAGIGRRSGGSGAFGLGWLAGATVVYVGALSFYSVWWGGHTFGPRYLLDVLVPAAPSLALGAERLFASRVGRAVAVVLLVGSMAIAAAGAFIYPHERWNIEPADVDQHHDRLWDWTDSQIRRTFRSPLSPQNFDLFTRHSFRRD